jgi:WD40 repeat protein
LTAEEFLRVLNRSGTLPANVGALKITGGTVSRTTFVQAFAGLVRAIYLGTPLQPGVIGQSLPDNTGEIDPLEGPSTVSNAIAFTADGRFALFASADKSLRLWDVEGGHETRRFVGHSASVWSVALSPNGKQALSGSMDTTVRLWDVESGSELKRFDGHEGLVTAVAFSPDGKQALSGGFDHQLVLWDLDKGKEIHRWHMKYINALCFAPAGNLAAVGAGASIHVVDVKSYKEIADLTGHTDSVTALAFSPDGKILVSGSDDRMARSWDIANNKAIGRFRENPSGIKAVAISPDGKILATGGADHTVRLWELASGRLLRTFSKHADLVSQVQFISEGKQTISASRDSAVLLWNLPGK